MLGNDTKRDDIIAADSNRKFNFEKSVINFWTGYRRYFDLYFDVLMNDYIIYAIQIMIIVAAI